ncbi:transposase, partial [Crystallibacter degradans]|uniref:transposase n=2 Tax=Micrococcaceae TaxID=1268 RepID=UPI001473A6A6
TWLQERPQEWRDGVEVVAMDGFSGFKSAAAEELPDAVPVMDPRAKGQQMMQAVIDSLSSGVPTALTELRTLGRTLKRRAQDVLA